MLIIFLEFITIFKKISIVLALCLSMTNLYAGIADGGACNNGSVTLTLSSNAADIATQDTSCTSGFCNLGKKQCMQKYGLEKACNRTAQCAEGTCSNSKCLLVAGSSCSVATNCSSGVCNWNTGQTNVLGKCA
jgi:hypothetical protein